MAYGSPAGEPRWLGLERRVVALWRPCPSLAPIMPRSVQVCPSLPSLFHILCFTAVLTHLFRARRGDNFPGFDVSAPAGQYLAARNARPRNPGWRCPFPPSSLVPLNAEGERIKRGRNRNATAILNLDDRLVVRIRISIFNADDFNKSPSYRLPPWLQPGTRAPLDGSPCRSTGLRGG